MLKLFKKKQHRKLKKRPNLFKRACTATLFLTMAALLLYNIWPEDLLKEPIISIIALALAVLGLWLTLIAITGFCRKDFFKILGMRRRSTFEFF